MAWTALVCAALTVQAVRGRAEDEPTEPTRAVASAAQVTGLVPHTAASMPAPGRPRGVAPGLPATRVAAASAVDAASPVAAASRAAAANDNSSAAANFVTEEKWGLAGYNNNEPIYTILITSRDPRIIRCTADLKGTYIENGQKLPVTDRQSTTVFPNAQVQIGNWSGMDQQSGAVYTVKCRPI
jgi:hypothetical protein